MAVISDIIIGILQARASPEGSSAAELMTPWRALWGSWAQDLSVSPMSLILGTSLHSASMTFLSSDGQIQVVVNQGREGMG